MNTSLQSKLHLSAKTTQPFPARVPPVPPIASNDSTAIAMVKGFTIICLLHTLVVFGKWRHFIGTRDRTIEMTGQVCQDTWRHQPLHFPVSPVDIVSNCVFIGPRLKSMFWSPAKTRVCFEEVVQHAVSRVDLQICGNSDHAHLSNRSPHHICISAVFRHSPGRHLRLSDCHNIVWLFVFRRPTWPAGHSNVHREDCRRERKQTRRLEKRCRYTSNNSFNIKLLLAYLLT
jgi:hypothetical protein